LSGQAQGLRKRKRASERGPPRRSRTLFVPLLRLRGRAGEGGAVRSAVGRAGERRGKLSGMPLSASLAPAVPSQARGCRAGLDPPKHVPQGKSRSVRAVVPRRVSLWRVKTRPTVLAPTAPTQTLSLSGRYGARLAARVSGAVTAATHAASLAARPPLKRSPEPVEAASRASAGRLGRVTRDDAERRL
jgi:hypothetical protein